MTVSTSDTERKDSYVYHVIRETTDILYDYGDSHIRGTYKTLEEANEAARRDLFKEDEYKKADLEDYSESTKQDGTVLINAGTGEVDFIVKVVCRIIPSDLNSPDRTVYIVNRTETTTSKTSSSNTTTTEKISKTVGIYQKEDSANEAAERELRKAAGIKSWRDRRKFKGVFREEYDLEGLFEGAATIKNVGAGEKGITVVVERRTLE
ncbi:uncharacterized protein H6S33_001770 [Morchella sextelata]|uniref:uncharacterized protein n=1 Tax=Morchella sextelata TaxID=1174677 RepID=UPI001D04E81D|nr:uncharacterized protein H6S33_001770 [Morchella sextelata]KAH0608636.1 hypothetical protein H6S33_001770 [Morchella sextelata]